MGVTGHCKSQAVLDGHPKIFNVRNVHSSDFLENSQTQERRTSDNFVNADFVEEYSQMSVSHMDAFQSKTNNKC